MQQLTYLTRLIVILLMVGVGNGAFAAPADTSKPADCSSLESYNKQNAVAIDNAIVTECIQRGGDLPKGLKVRDGQNAGTRVSGSSGVSNSGIHAASSGPGARKANASISGAKIKFSCNFPPRIKLGIPPKIDIPKGSCYEFLAGLMKDKSGATVDNAAIQGTDDLDCPEESDTTGVYGVKSPLTPGSSTLTCGAMIPATTVDTVLNSDSDALLATEEGSYYVWLYKFTGTDFTPIAEKVPLPMILCSTVASASGAPEKSVDLTPPMAQMISFNLNDSFISVRLQSRATMDANFVPKYDEYAPEKFLIIPIVNGVPEIPKDCDPEEKYFTTSMSDRDIVIHSSTDGGCTQLSADPTIATNNTMTCPTGSTLQNGSCVDSKGKKTAPKVTSTMASECPGKTKPVNGKCPQMPNLPPDAVCAAGTQGSQPNKTCVVASLQLSEAECLGRTQYGVLTRPNLYYPPGSTSKLYPLPGRTAMIAKTVPGGLFYTQPLTSFFLQPTSPNIKFNEGGSIVLKDDSIIMMEQESEVSMVSNQVFFNKGGQYATGGGTQIQAFTAGTAFKIPSNLMMDPLEVHTNGSVEFPPGLFVPTSATNTYFRLPSAAPPQ